MKLFGRILVSAFAAAGMWLLDAPQWAAVGFSIAMAYIVFPEKAMDDA